jgi:hypothetical protein
MPNLVRSAVQSAGPAAVSFSTRRSDSPVAGGSPGRAGDPGLLASAAAAGGDTVIAGLPRGYDTLLDRQL